MERIEVGIEMGIHLGTELGGVLLVLLRVVLVTVLVWLACAWLREKSRPSPEPKNPTDLKRR